jgi:hypothetical protein
MQSSNCRGTATLPAHPPRRATTARRRIAMDIVAVVMLGSIALFLLQQLGDIGS